LGKRKSAALAVWHIRVSAHALQTDYFTKVMMSRPQLVMDLQGSQEMAAGRAGGRTDYVVSA